MRKLNKFKNAIAMVMIALMMSSCATVFGGKITSAQKTKPSSGSREIRVGALVADILLFWPGLIVDFATGAIYKPNK